MAYELRRDGYLVSDDRARLDFAVIHGYLTTSYWTPGISLEQVRRQSDNSSLVFGLYKDESTPSTSSGDTSVAVSGTGQNENEGRQESLSGDLNPAGSNSTQESATGVSPLLGSNVITPVQLGFARVLSDLTRFAYLCDVFVLSEAQGRGLGKLLIGAIKAHPDLVDVRRWVLATKDAHGLYAQFGFTPLPKPAMWMSIDPDKEKPQRWV